MRQLLQWSLVRAVTATCLTSRAASSGSDPRQQQRAGHPVAPLAGPQVAVAAAPGARIVSLRSASTAAIFCETPAGFLLCSTEVFVPPSGQGDSGGRWAVLFDVPTLIVAGDAVWDLRPSSFAVTRNDSARGGGACVNFTGSVDGLGQSPFWVESCIDAGGLLSFEAVVAVTAGTALAPARPEPQVLLQRSTPAVLALEQGPLSIYSDHDPSDGGSEDKTQAAAPCSSGLVAGALGHGVGMPAAFGQWALGDGSSGAAGTGVCHLRLARLTSRTQLIQLQQAERAVSCFTEWAEAAVFFNLSASEWFSRSGHGRSS